MKTSYDAVVIGSGPNGLAAAITLAREGRSVIVYEAQPTIGGGAKTEALTLPGFLHDVCSAVHPLAIASPFFRSLPLHLHGLEWIHSPAPLAHPLDDEDPVVLERSVEATAAGLGQDRSACLRLFKPLLERWPDLKDDILAPVKWPKHPLLLSRFGLRALWPAMMLAKTVFRGARARALFGGLCAHSVLPLEWMASSAIGLVLGLAAQADGWPLPRGGSQAISQALASYLETLGGKIVSGCPIESLQQLPPSRAVIFDLTPRQILKIAQPRLSQSYQSRLHAFRYGPGVFKLDWALMAPIPWKAPECARAATVHLGGDLEEIAASERACWNDSYVDKPFVLLVQPSLFDSSRAPAGRHTAWAYCHVPNGSKVDLAERIERQVERFAPGFRNLILGRSVLNPEKLEQRNANLVGGDIGGGATLLPQLFLRPTPLLYATSDPALFICSSSTPPGGGVHGMGGYFAARAVLKTCLQ